MLLGSSSTWRAVPWWIFPVAVCCAVIGTWIGRQLLERLDDHRFRRWSTALVIAISLTALAKGLG